MLVSIPATAKFTHLTEAERAIIRRMRQSRSSPAFIARYLHKHRSSISREIRRNANGAGIYFEGHAQAFVRKRRRQAKANARIIENDLQLEAYIERLLKFGLSPEQIAGYMRRVQHLRALSYRTIYRWVHRAW